MFYGLYFRPHSAPVQLCLPLKATLEGKNLCLLPDVKKEKRSLDTRVCTFLPPIFLFILFKIFFYVDHFESLY